MLLGVSLQLCLLTFGLLTLGQLSVVSLSLCVFGPLDFFDFDFILSPSGLSAWRSCTYSYSRHPHRIYVDTLAIRLIYIDIDKPFPRPGLATLLFQARRQG